MNNAMEPALLGLARRMPRVVREHEILRIAGWFKDSDANNAAETAIGEILAWAQNRCGGRLPHDAWDHKSFEYLAGGRNSSGVRLQLAEVDVWAVRADDPDKNVPGRTWTTEVVVGRAKDKPCTFSARLLANTAEAYLNIEPHSPGFIDQILENLIFMRGNALVSSSPLIVANDESAGRLVDHLVDPKRLLPTIVVTMRDDRFERPKFLDIDKLARATAGYAHVVLLKAAFTQPLIDRVGKYRAVFNGGARIYMPGFEEDSDPFQHRLVLADQINTPEDASRTNRWLRQMAAEESIRRVKLGQDVFTFSSLRSELLKVRRATLEQEGASDSAKLSTMVEQVKELEHQLEENKGYQTFYAAEADKERERAELAESRVNTYAHRIQELTDALKERGDDPDNQITSPETWADLPDWCDKYLTGRLSLTQTARRGARAPDYENVGQVARCLQWLATECRDRRISGGQGTLREVIVEDSIRNAACGSDEYEFDWNGRRFTADWHIKNGGNTRDPSLCLRIYYCFDEQSQQIIISDMPAHRKTEAS